MIVLDANLLLYAHVSSFAEHEQARTWLNHSWPSAARVAIPWSSALAFVRIATNPRLFSEPESIADAWAQVGRWLDSEPVWTPNPTGAIVSISNASLVSPDLGPTMSLMHTWLRWPFEHGRRLATADSGFARFPRPRLVQPPSSELGGRVEGEPERKLPRKLSITLDEHLKGW